MRILSILIFILTTINANFIDKDLDGVEDSIDKCPNSKLFDIVDKDGCSKENLLNQNNKTKNSKLINYSIALNYFYSKDFTTNKTYSISFSFNYKDFNFFIDTSTYSINDENKLEDTTVALFYSFDKVLKYTIGIGSYIPMDNEESNKVDFFTKFKIYYSFNKIDAFISYQKIFNRDKDSSNTKSLTFNIGYNFNKNLYYSLSYTKNSTDNENKSEYLSLFSNYYINKNVYISANYTKGLNKNSIDKSYSLSIGYDF